MDHGHTHTEILTATKIQHLRLQKRKTETQKNQIAEKPSKNAVVKRVGQPRTRLFI